MKRNIPALLLIMLVIMLITPAAADAAQRPTPPGVKKVHVDVYHSPDKSASLQDDTVYPAKYDPRTEDWFRTAIQVKNQGDLGLCWAFATSSTAEISWAKEQHDKGQTVQPLQVSPLHLGYFLFHQPVDPLGGTKGDSNHPIEKEWYDEGGSIVGTMQFLANQADFVPESFMPYTLDEWDSYIGPMSFDASKGYGHSALILENSGFVNFASELADPVKGIKSMIERYGALVATVEINDEYFTNDISYYNPPADGESHAVSIIGWDDNYAVTNFQEKCRPEHPGAWLAMNSWGTVDLDGTPRHDGGFFWISYESRDIINTELLGMDLGLPDEASDVLQYDGTADGDSENMEADEEVANVFEVPKGRLSETLTRIGFTSYSADPTDYQIQVFTGLSDPSLPTSGWPHPVQTVHTDRAGYNMFTLDEPIEVNRGQYFSVCVMFSEPAAIGVEVDHGSNAETVGLAPGQSFVLYKNMAWKDAANDYDKCYRIKAIAVPEMCEDHDFEYLETVPPQKGVKGYDLYWCWHCAYEIKDNWTPALKPVPDKTKITKLVPTRKAMTVKWRRSNEKIVGKNIDGYQIRYSLKKNMKGAKTVTVKGWTVTSKKIKKLKSKKKYYVQIRTYKKTGSKTYRSAWSRAKAVRTK